MSEIQQIVHQIFEETEATDHEDIIRLAMIRYAELYAAKVLRIAADNVTYKQYYDEEGEVVIGINQESILNIKLPEHI